MIPCFEMATGKPAANWKPGFIDLPRPYYSSSLQDAEKYWQKYEYQRRYHRPDIPKLVVKNLHGDDIDIQITPYYCFVQRVHAEHGHVLATALRSIKDMPPPLYAIKRKGKTQALVKEIFGENVVHVGMYMMFWDLSEVVLAKITLATNIAYSYDLEQYHDAPLAVVA